MFLSSERQERREHAPTRATIPVIAFVLRYSGTNDAGSHKHWLAVRRVRKKSGYNRQSDESAQAMRSHSEVDSPRTETGGRENSGMTLREDALSFAGAPSFRKAIQDRRRLRNSPRNPSGARSNPPG